MTDPQIETLLFACANDPVRVVQLIAYTWDAEKYNEIFENEKPKRK